MQFRIITLLAGLLISLSAISQDYIYLNNGDRIEAIVSEQTKTAVIYRIFGSAQEDIKLVNKSDIKMIAYSDGKIENYSDTKMNIGDKDEDFKKNLFAYHLVGLLINNFTLL